MLRPVYSVYKTTDKQLKSKTHPDKINIEMEDKINNVHQYGTAFIKFLLLMLTCLEQFTKLCNIC